MRMYWLIAAFVLACALALLDFVALSTFLYWRQPWFDTIVHALGGATLGTFAIALLYGSHKPKRYLAFVVIIALSWEVFEFALGLSYGPRLLLDTASDLLFDTIGLLIPYFIARKTVWRSV